MEQLSSCSEEKDLQQNQFYTHCVCVCILALARESFNNDLMALYEDLFKGNTLTFDLTQGQPCFRMAKDLSVVNIEEFKRKIKTEYEEGKEDEYFK